MDKASAVNVGHIAASVTRNVKCPECGAGRGDPCVISEADPWPDDGPAVVSLGHVATHLSRQGKRSPEESREERHWYLDPLVERYGSVALVVANACRQHRQGELYEPWAAGPLAPADIVMAGHLLDLLK